MQFTTILFTAMLAASHISAQCITSAGSITYTQDGGSAQARFFVKEKSGRTNDIKCDYRGSPITWNGLYNHVFEGDCSGGKGGVKIRLDGSKIQTIYTADKNNDRQQIRFENTETSRRNFTISPGRWDMVIQFAGRSRGC